MNGGKMGQTVTPKRPRDLPPEVRCAFQDLSGSMANVGFRDGKFYAIEWLEWESFWTPLPNGVNFILTGGGGVVPDKFWRTSSSNVLKMAEIAMSPKGYGFSGKLASIMVKNLIWC